MAYRENYSSFTATEVTTTDTSNWTTGGSLTFTPANGVDYFILWSLNYTNDTDLSKVKVRIRTDTTDITNFAVEPKNSADYAHHSGFYKLTGAGASVTITISIQSDVGVNARGKNFGIVAIRAGANDQYAEALTRTTVTSTTPTTVANCSFSASAGSSYLALVSLFGDNTNTTTPVYFNTRWNTVSDTDESGIGTSDTSALMPGFGIRNVTTAAGTNTLELQIRSQLGSITVGATGSRILLLNLNDLNNSWYNRGATNGHISTSASPSTASTITATTAANPHILLASWNSACSTTAVQLGGNVDQDGTDIAQGTVRSIGSSSTRPSSQSFLRLINPSAASHTWKIEVWGDGANTHQVNVPTLALLDLGSATVNATANLSVGSLTLTGQTPTLSSSTSVDTSTSSLAITELVPTLSSSTSADTSTSSLTITELVPTTSINVDANLNFSGLTLTGYVPSASVSTLATIAASNLTLNEQTVTTSASVNALLSTSSLNLNEFDASTTSSATTTLDTTAVAIEGFAPEATAGISFEAELNSSTLVINEYDIESTATQSYNATVESSSLSLSGLSISILSNASADINSSELIITPNSQTTSSSVLSDIEYSSHIIIGYDIAATASCSVLPDSGELLVTGYAPSVDTDTIATIDLTELAIQGQDISVLANVDAEVTICELDIVGFEPDIVVGDGDTAYVGFDQLLITGYAVTASSGNSARTALGALTVQGLAPSVRIDYSIQFGQGYARITGRNASLSADVNCSTEFTDIELLGYMPNPSISFERDIGVHNLSLQQFNFDVVGNVTSDLNSSSMDIDGFAPFATTDYQEGSVGLGQIQFTPNQTYTGVHKKRRYIFSV